MLSETTNLETPQRTLFRTGTVLSVSGDALVLEADGELLSARRAPGCQPDPREEDTVLFLEVDGRGPVVTTVLLSGPDDSPRTMTFPGGVRLRSDGEIGMEAPRFRGVFSDFSLSARTLSLAGDLLSLAGQRITLVGQTLERVERHADEQHRGQRQDVPADERPQQVGQVPTVPHRPGLARYCSVTMPKAARMRPSAITGL